MANGSVDSYITDVIGRGDEGSALLAKLVAPTLRNCQYVDVIREGMNGIAVLRVPPGHKVLVHSAAGASHEKDVVYHVDSLVDRLFEQESRISARILTAISSGVSAPIPMPIGECTDDNCSSEIPASLSFFTVSDHRFRDPMTPI